MPLDDLAAQALAFDLELDRSLLHAVFGRLLDVVKSMNSGLALSGAGLRRLPNPLQFPSVQIFGSLGRRPLGLQALLFLFQVIGIAAVVAVQRLVLQFQNPVAHRLQKVPVVGDHQESKRGVSKRGFQRFNQVQIQVVGGLVQQNDFRLLDKQTRQRQTFALTTGQVFNGKIRQGQFHLREHGAHFRLGIPRV